MSATATDTSLLTAALDLAARGLHVFPLKPNTKVPALKKDWEGRANADPVRIERCWRTGPFNIGVACGPSGLYVLDLDVPKPGKTEPPAPPFDQPGVNDGADALALLAAQHAERFPFDTYTVTTGRGGTHLYFTRPDDSALRNTAGKLGWLIDTRGVGGYVVGPGSIVDGKPYRVTTQSGVAPLPAWIRRQLQPPKRPARTGPRPRFGAPSKYASTVLRGELDKVLSARPGTRNDTLNRVAFTLGTHVARGTLPADLVQRALDEVADRLGGDVNKSLDTIRNGLKAGAQKGEAQ